MKEYVCNKCGKFIGTEGQIIKEDFLYVNKKWGYFSKKDGEVHEFCLCEKCYDSLLDGFKVAAKVEESSELL